MYLKIASRGFLSLPNAIRFNLPNFIQSVRLLGFSVFLLNSSTVWNRFVTFCVHHIWNFLKLHSVARKLYIPYKYDQVENEKFVERRRAITFFSCSSSILIELEFGGVGFCEGRNTGEPGEKPSEKGENQPTYDTTPESYPDPTSFPEPGKGPGDELSDQCDIPARNTQVSHCIFLVYFTGLNGHGIIL